MKYGNIRGEVDGTYQLVGETYIDGAYAQYKCDEDAANTTVADSGYGANGAVASTNTSNLASTGAFDFAGSSEYVDMTALVSDIASDTVGSISFWMNIDTLTDGVCMFSIQDASAPSIIHVNLLDAAGSKYIYFQSRLNGGAFDLQVRGNTALSISTWYHVCITQDGANLRMYLDGVEETLTYTTSTNRATWFADLSTLDRGRIANYQNNGSGTPIGPFDGQIDDVRYYKYPLTANQVAEIYNSGTVDESVVMTAPATTIEFTGLDGDTDEEYMLYAKHWGTGDFNMALGTASGYITSAYGNQRMYVLADTASGNLQSANSTNAGFIQLGNTDSGTAGNFSVVNIFTPKGLPKTAWFKTAHDFRSGSASTWVQGNVFDNALETNNANITSMKVYSSTASGLQEGTHVILMKKVNNDSMKVGDMVLNGTALTEPPDPYAYYKLNETSGTTTKDFGYGANDGTLTNATADEVTADGKIDRAYHFNGSDEHVDITTLEADIDSDTSGTVAAWIYADALPANKMAIFTLGGTATIDYFYLQLMSTGKLKAGLADSPSLEWTLETDNADISATTWHHVACVHNGIEATLYVDGVATAQTFAISTKKSAWFSEIEAALDNGYIGCTNWATDGKLWFWDGKIDDVRYYKYALEADQVEQLYKLGVPDGRATAYGMWEKIKEVKIDGPFCHMKMEDNSDTGSGANAVSNIGTPTYTSGKIGNALSCDGSTDALNTDAFCADVRTDTIGSVSLWFNRDTSDTANRCVFSLGDTDADNRFQILINNPSGTTCAVRSFIVAGGSTKWQVNYDTTTATWHHLVITHDGVAPKYYIDGAEVTYTTEDSTDLTAWFSGAGGASLDNGRVGCSNYASGGNARFFDGLVDDVRYYQRVISAREVADIYNSGTGSQSAVANQVANSINFTGLDGDTDTLYKIVMNNYRATGALSAARLKVNSDANTNYYYSFVEGINTTADAGQGASAYFYGGDHSASESLMAEIYFYARGGTVRPLINSYMAGVSSTTVGSTLVMNQVYNLIGGNITNLLIDSSNAGAFYNGSRVELWRLNLQESY